MKTESFKFSKIKTKIVGHEYEYHNHVFFALNFADAKVKARAIYEEHIDDFKTFTLTELKGLCADYDERWGAYPESDYEGKAVFEFITGVEN
jgi:hypothetical protein